MVSWLCLNISEVMHWEHVEKIKVRSFRCRTGKVLVLNKRGEAGRGLRVQKMWCVFFVYVCLCVCLYAHAFQCQAEVVVVCVCGCVWVCVCASMFVCVCWWGRGLA